MRNRTKFLISVFIILAAAAAGLWWLTDLQSKTQISEPANPSGNGNKYPNSEPGQTLNPETIDEKTAKPANAAPDSGKNSDSDIEKDILESEKQISGADSDIASAGVEINSGLTAQ